MSVNSNISWFEWNFKCLYFKGHNTKARAVSSQTDASLTTSSFCKQKLIFFPLSSPKTVAMPTHAIPCLNLGKSLSVTNFCP